MVSLTDIPPDVMEQVVFDFLDYPSIFNLKLTCKQFSSLTLVNEQVKKEKVELLNLYLRNVKSKIRALGEKLDSPRYLSHCLENLSHFVERQVQEFKPKFFPDLEIKIPFYMDTQDSIKQYFYIPDNVVNIFKSIIENTKLSQVFDDNLFDDCIDPNPFLGHKIIPITVTQFKVWGEDGTRINPVTRTNGLFYDVTLERNLKYDKDLKRVDPRDYPFFMCKNGRIVKVDYLDVIRIVEYYS